ncbi:uncharacterized protein LOC107270552 isoform X2 [Cephus cinctus]|uniref:RNA-binding protein 48 n=1 Tax=Cephus cinctus TaxID=211228 RepID=A0AAJ7FNY5_CEPCN|nr:uncharacterized protein LOC107270552 isoform X2 [Cephus cinctus]
MSNTCCLSAREKVDGCQGSRLVYTVNDESQHLMICGVPKLHLTEEVKRLMSPYGDVKKIHVVADYPTEQFTEVYHVHYVRIQSARIAKRFVDGKNFYGGILHVFYAPELESITETRAKLIQRRKDIASRIRRHQEDPINPQIDLFVPKEQYQRKKKMPTLPLTEDRLAQNYPGESFTTIYNGIPREIDPRPVSEPSLPSNWSKNPTRPIPAHELLQSPYQLYEPIMREAGVRESKLFSNETNFGKKRNYKGHIVEENAKVKIVRPQIIDTRNIAKKPDPKDKNIFTNVKRVENGITIKLLPKHQDEKKRIIIKNSSITHLVQPSVKLQSSIENVKSQIREAMAKK